MRSIVKETSDYGSRLKALKEAQHAELLEKRPVEIGELAERLGLLGAEDDALVGVFRCSFEAIRIHRCPF